MIPYLLGTVALVAWLVLPGLAIGVLAERKAPIPSRARIGLFALTGGLTFWYLGSQVLVRLGGLSTVVVWLITVALAAGAVALLRGPGKAVIAQLEFPHFVPSVVIGAAATALAIFPILEIVARRDDTFVGSTPWYYWGLTQETIRAGGFPQWSWEWAMKLPFLADYPAFTSASAVLGITTGQSTDLAAARLMIVVAAAATGFASFLLARALGADRFAAGVATVVMMAGATFSSKLVSFRPEGAGYALMLLIPAAAIDFLRSRRPSSLVLVATAGLALSQVHGLDWVFAMAVVGALSVVAVLMAPSRRSAAGVSLALLAAVGITWVVGNAVLGGGLSGAGKLGGLPRVVNGFDPTYAFRGLVGGALEWGPAPSLFSMFVASLRPDFIGGSREWWTVGGVVTLVALGYVAVQRGQRRRDALRLMLVIGVTLVLVVAFSSWLAIKNSTFVPRRTGFSRVLLLVFTFLPLSLAVVLSAIATRRRIVAGVLGAVVVAVAFVPAAANISDHEGRSATPDTLRELRALDLGDDALVLTNFYSEGFVPEVTGARGALDGRAPYTEGRTLELVNEQLRRSIEFFGSPLDAPDPALPLDGITHILIATGPGWSLGAFNRFDTNEAMLDRRVDLRLIGSDPSYRLYGVVR